MFKLIINKININELFYIFFIISLVYFKIFHLNYNFYFNQFDIFGQFKDIYNYKNNFNFSLLGIFSYALNFLDEKLIYKTFLFFILSFNSIVFFIFLKITLRTEPYVSFFISIININFLYSFTRFYYGHITLTFIFFIILGAICLKTHYEEKDKNLFLYLFYIIIYLALLSHFQIGVYSFLFGIINIFIFYNIKDLILYFKKKINLHLVCFSIVLIVFYFSFSNKIQEHEELGRLFYSLDYLNKYSLSNPLEFFINLKNYYENIVELIGHEEIKRNYFNYVNYIKNYSINGPEFQHFYGITIFMVLIYGIITSDKKFEYLKFYLIFIFIIILTLNNFYFFSLLKVHHYFLPMVRSVMRIYIIIDLFILIFLGLIMTSINNKKANFILFFIILIEIFLFNPHEKIKYNENDMSIADLENKSLRFCSQKIKFEEKIFYEYLSMINRFTFNDRSNYCITNSFDKSTYGENYFQNNLIKIYYIKSDDAL